MKKNISIFLFCDALGYELVSKHRFLERELPHRYPVLTQLGYSSTAVPTILTGAPPTEHGHFSFFHKAEEGKSPFSFFRGIHWLLHPDFFFNNHRIRHRLSDFLKRKFGYSGYFSLYQVPYSRLPYFDYCEKKDIFAERGLAPVDNLRDMLRKTGIPYFISDWRKGDDANFAEAESVLEKASVDFMFLYTASMDGFLHFNVGNTEGEAARLAAYGEQVRALLKTASGNYENVRFFLISDHGMTPLAEAVDLKKIVEKLPLKFGVDYLACYDSTMFRVYVLNPQCRQTLMDSVKGMHGHWLSEEEKKNWNVDFKDRLYGDEIFLTDPGFQIVPSDMGSKPIPGMHGFSPDDRYSTASLLSNVTPDFVPVRIADFFRLMKSEAEKAVNP